MKYTVGTYGQRIPLYKKKIRGIIGKPYYEKTVHLEDFKRFHTRAYIKKFTKYKDVISCRSKVVGIECGDYIRIEDPNCDKDDDDDGSFGGGHSRIDAIYDADTKNYLAGI